jgi:4'-phosphopantetheinyl transferase
MSHGADHDREAGQGQATWWLARGESQPPSAADWLSVAERNRAGAMRYTKRRTDFLLSRWTLKLAVAKVLGWPADPAMLARIEGRAAPTGAPLLCIDGQPVNRGISLSDRAGCAVCLVAACADAVGCDVETIEPRTDAFVRDYLTQAEQRFVDAAGPVRDMAVTVIWSAKESALKVLGTGLRRDTRSVEVTVVELGPAERTWSELRVRTAEGAVFSGWWRRSGAFVVTTCGPSGWPSPTALEARSPIDTMRPSHHWTGRPVS